MYEEDIDFSTTYHEASVNFLNFYLKENTDQFLLEFKSYMQLTIKS
jgi:hypothetical protein